MKSILFVRNLDDEQCIPRIEAALEGTRVEFTIALERKAVVVEGRNDIVHSAKIALQEAGFIVE